MCRKILTVLILVLDVALSARILAVIPTPSYSHQIPFKPLWEELSLRGHQITLLTTDPIRNSSLVNITEIDLSFSYKVLQDQLLNLIDSSQNNVFQYVKDHYKIFSTIGEEQLSHQSVKELIQNKNLHFDVLFVEMMHPIMATFARRFNCPFIGILSTDSTEEINGLLGNPIHPILYHGFYAANTPKTTLWGRIKISIMNLIFIILTTNYVDNQDVIIEKHFGREYVPLRHTIYNMSLLFMKSNPIFQPVKPLVPAIIRISGGNEVRPQKPLPKDLKLTLDEAKQGAIYFSLGSNVNSKDLPDGIRNTILEAFSELPYTILWKFEEEFPNKTKNVVISKWFPQQDVLAHPNMKLFITHGGKQSLDDAIYYKLPIIGMPFFADQPLNVQDIISKGVGLQLNYKTMDKKIFMDTILEVVENPRYRNRMIELSDLVMDEPMTGLERAIWWTEYVIRHKGARHLRAPALDMPTYQYYLLDVIGVCLLALILLIYFMIKLCQLLKYFVIKTKVKIE